MLMFVASNVHHSIGKQCTALSCMRQTKWRQSASRHAHETNFGLSFSDIGRDMSRLIGDDCADWNRTKTINLTAISHCALGYSSLFQPRRAKTMKISIDFWVPLLRIKFFRLRAEVTRFATNRNSTKSTNKQTKKWRRKTRNTNKVKQVSRREFTVFT